MRVRFVVMALGLVTGACAQVVPNGFDTVDANATFALSSTATAGRVYQYQIDSSQLTAFVGMNLNGLQWRLNASIAADWPNATATFSQWDIFIGAGVDPSARSTTFADNFVGTPTQVRSGGLTITAGSFSSTGSPVKPFGPAVSFSNYFYGGGDLTIEMRFSGQTGGNTPTFDAGNSSTSGYGTVFGASWASSSTATTATGSPTANFLVTNIVASPVPEPATCAVLGVGVLTLLRKARRKRS